jgi:hypothetical protein
MSIGPYGFTAAGIGTLRMPYDVYIMSNKISPTRQPSRLGNTPKLS